MRYSLRNIGKIEDAVGWRFAQQHIIHSLNIQFDNPSPVEDYIVERSIACLNAENKYTIIRINDYADLDDMLEFAIVGQTWDVVHLAYLGRIKG